jgi:hypothetical protein
MEKEPKKNAGDIVPRKCLLIMFYVRASILDESMEALRTAKDSVISLCQTQFCLPKHFSIVLFISYWLYHGLGERQQGFNESMLIY